MNRYFIDECKQIVPVSLKSYVQFEAIMSGVTTNNYNLDDNFIKLSDIFMDQDFR